MGFTGPLLLFFYILSWTNMNMKPEDVLQLTNDEFDKEIMQASIYTQAKYDVYECGISKDGKMLCYYYDKMKKSNVQVEPELTSNSHFVSLDIGHNQTGCGIQNIDTEKNVIQCWGENFKQLSFDSDNYSIVSVGRDRVCALTNLYKIECKRVSDNVNVGEKLDEYVSLSHSDNHLCAITRNYKIKCWEYETDYELEKEVKEENFYSISCRYNACCAITFDSKVKCWKFHDHDDLNNIIKAPTILELENVVQVELDDVKACFLQKDGSFSYWDNSEESTSIIKSENKYTGSLGRSVCTQPQNPNFYKKLGALWYTWDPKPKVNTNRPFQLKERMLETIMVPVKKQIQVCANDSSLRAHEITKLGEELNKITTKDKSHQQDRKSVV